jgi:uncharacterized protein
MGDLEGGTLVGYAALWHYLSEDLGGFVELIRPGAFLRSIGPGGLDIRALWNHNPEKVLGRSKNGTLALKEDDKGLRVTIRLPDSSLGRDVLEVVRRGDVNQMSFGFTVEQDIWSRDRETGRVLRELLEVRLHEVSPVTFPAYPSTTIAARAKAALAGRGLLPGLQECRPSLDLLRRRLEMAERGLAGPARRR